MNILNNSRTWAIQFLSLSTLLLVAALLMSTANSGDLAAAERFYREALKQSQMQERIELLNQSITASPTFEAWYARGRAEQTTGNHDQAIVAFDTSIPLAARSRFRGLSKGRIAFSLSELDRKFEAARMAHDALALLSEEKTRPADQWIFDLSRELDQSNSQRIIKSDEISRALGMTARFGFVIEANVDIHTQFQFDSHQLDSDGITQVDEMIDAISTLLAQTKAVQIIGHTDKRGDDEYNQTLSERRATTVKNRLADAFASDAVQFCAKGLGETKLLYDSDNEDDHAINRRVELKFVDSCL